VYVRFVLLLTVQVSLVKQQLLAPTMSNQNEIYEGYTEYMLYHCFLGTLVVCALRQRRNPKYLL
jgi:hypothetical protein